MVSVGHPKQKQQANAKGDNHTLSKKEKGIEILVEQQNLEEEGHDGDLI